MYKRWGNVEYTTLPVKQSTNRENRAQTNRRDFVSAGKKDIDFD